MKAEQESVITVKDEAGNLIAVVHQNGGSNLKIYMTKLGNWEDYERLLNTK